MNTSILPLASALTSVCEKYSTSCADIDFKNPFLPMAMIRGWCRLLLVWFTVVSEPHTVMLLVTSPRTARSCLHCKLGVQNRHSFLTKHFEFPKFHPKMGSEWEWQRMIRYRTCPTQLPPVSLLSVQCSEWHKPQADSLLFCSLRGLGRESTHSSVSSPVKAHCISTKIESTQHLMHRQLALTSATVAPTPRTNY